MVRGLTWIAILVSGLALTNTLFSNILERQREFAALRAVGTKRDDVARRVVGEAVSTALKDFRHELWHVFSARCAA